MKKTFTFDSDEALEYVLESFEEYLLANGYAFEGNLYVVDTSEFVDEEEEE
jgi:hypothetical protein